MGRSTFRTLLWSAVFVSLAEPALPAPGHVFGLVSHSQALEGVTVRLWSKRRGLVGETVTDASGQFRFRQLKAGNYSLEFELQGFDFEWREDFAVRPGMTSNYYIEMGLGALERASLFGQIPLITERESSERLLRNRSLLQAIVRGDIDGARALIRGGVDLSHGQGALVAAVDTRNDAMLEILIEAGADVNAPAHEQRSALLAATGARRVETVRRLLRAGADASKKGRYGESPLELAARYGFGDIIAVLLEAGANVDSRDKDGRTPLFRVADVETALRLLEGGADIDARDHQGETSLIHALGNLPRPDRHLLGSRASVLELVHTLLVAGADPEVRDDDGRTAAMTALLRYDTAAARELVIRGAAVPMAPEKPWKSRAFQWLTAKDVEPLLHEVREERASLQRLLDRERCEAETAHAALLRTGQYCECRCGTRSVRQESVGSCVRDGESFVSPDDAGRTALRRAAGSGDFKLAMRLVDGGADVNAVDSEGRTALIRATVVGRADIVEILLGSGADGGSPLVTGMRALELAAVAGHEDIVRHLLKAGVNPSWTDPEGRTAAMLAALSGHDSIARELRRAQTRLVRRR